MRRENRLVIHHWLPWVSRERSAPEETTEASVASSQPAANVVVRRPKLARLRGLGIVGASLASILLALVLVTALVVGPAQGAFAAPAPPPVAVVVAFGPPALPIYYQPPLPGPSYIWVPGYWAWDPYYGYFWVPGTWVPAPFSGALWTPGYWWWSDDDDGFLWAPGYWGPAVGYYGGIDYGYGYPGYGYEGGYWDRGRFYYNRSVTNITIRNITTVYNKPVANDVDSTRVSYHGGRGGTNARPTPEQLNAAREKRLSATSIQLRQVEVARADQNERASVNHGRPAIAATVRAGEFSGHGAVPARRAGAPYKEPPIREARPTAPAPARSRARTERGSPPNPHGYREQPPAQPRPHVAPPPAAHERPAPPRAAPQQPNRPEPPPRGRRAQPQERRNSPQPPERRPGPERPQIQQRPQGPPHQEQPPRSERPTNPPGPPRR
jgi:hypothetical protein